MNYIKQLDSIRAIAVMLVIISHWFPESHPLYIYTSVFNGVDIFFVLSGFLITRILLKNRNEAEKIGIPKLSVIRIFFSRRVLRIFPIYYVTLFLLFILGNYTGTDIRNNFIYFITYTSNFYFYFKQDWEGILSHLWSLAVEEQFYMVWPWFILFLHKRSVLPFILASVVIGILAQVILTGVNLGNILTFACLDGLGLGALLAWLFVYQPLLVRKYFPVFLIIALICFMLQVTRVFSPGSLIFLPSRTLTAFCTIGIITSIILHRENKSFWCNTILGSPPLLFIGKISYGVYLYHLIIPNFFSWVFTRLNEYLPAIIYQHNFYLVQLENFCLLLVISYLSWIIIEKPILQLKSHFELPEVEVETASPKAAFSRFLQHK